MSMSFKVNGTKVKAGDLVKINGDRVRVVTIDSQPTRSHVDNGQVEVNTKPSSVNDNYDVFDQDEVDKVL
jgi:hypothetical protein